MKNNKPLLIAGIISLVLIIFANLFNLFSITFDVFETLAVGEKVGAEVVFYFLIQLFTGYIPLLICLVITIVSFVKRYFNWLSILNAVLVVLLVVQLVLPWVCM